LNGITPVPNFMILYLPSDSEVISGRRTDRQTGDLIRLLSFFESRLQIGCGMDSAVSGEGPVLGVT
jgi:hypothetical protein